MARAVAGIGCPHCEKDFFSIHDAVNHLAKEHPDQPRAQAWLLDKEGKGRIDYFPGMGAAHSWTLSHGGKPVSRMTLDEQGRISSLETHPEHRRQGHATTLYQAAKELTSDGPTAGPAPKHSSLRTPSGDAWAKSTNEELPRLQNVSQAQFRDARWD